MSYTISVFKPCINAYCVINRLNPEIETFWYMNHNTSFYPVCVNIVTTLAYLFIVIILTLEVFYLKYQKTNKTH